MIYILAIIILLTGVVLERHANQSKILPIQLAIEWLILVCIAGFRYRLGGDTLFYMDMYDSWPSLQEWNWDEVLSNRYQPLWYLFCALCKSISLDFTCFQFAHAIVVNTIFFRFFHKYSSRPFLAILLYAIFFYPYYNFEVLRAALSVCMFLLGYDYLIQRRWVAYFLFVIIAFGFHLEAALLILIPSMFIVNNSKTLTYISIIILAFILAFTGDLISAFFSHFTNSERIFLAVVSYIERDKPSLSIFNLITFAFSFLTYVLALSLSRKDERLNIFSFFILWEMISIIFRMRYSVFFKRTMDFSHPFIILYLSNLIALRKEFSVSIKKTFANITLIGFIFLYGKTYFKPLNNIPFYRLYLPYTSIFDKETDTERENNLYIYRDE